MTIAPILPAILVLKEAMIVVSKTYRMTIQLPSNNSTIEFESTVNWDCITPTAITSANTIATMASSDPTDTTPIPTVDQTPTVDNNSDLLSPKTINNPPLANPNHPASSGRKDNTVTIPANMSDSTSNWEVCDMFQQLMDKMSSIKEDLTSEIKELKAEKSSICDQVNSMKTQQEAQNGRIDKLRTIVASTK